MRITKGIILSAIALSGCQDNRQFTEIDKRHGICLRLDSGLAYRALPDSIDFSAGFLTSSNREIASVYAGRHPPFNGETPAVDNVGEQFSFLGTQEAGKDAQVLWAARTKDRGLFYVMFAAPTNSEIRMLLEKENIVAACRDGS